MIVEVSRDVAELKICALAQMVYANQLAWAGEDRADRVKPPEVSAAHLAWVNYLMQVERRTLRMPQLASRLPADVAEGLEAIEAARARFRQEHRQCPCCGRWRPWVQVKCPCGKGA